MNDIPLSETEPLYTVLRGSADTEVAAAIEALIREGSDTAL